MIRLCRELVLPLDVVTETIAILAKRRVGKSYTARRLVEQLLEARLQVVVVDPKGDWWGLRSSADGKRPGYPVLIAGGEHGDVPIEASGGEVLARFVVEQRVSLVLDLSSFRKHEIATFMTGFLETLYRLKARTALQTPMMLVIDEGDAIAPQVPQQNEARMLGAAEDIVRRGGQRGIGCTMISQRAAVLNKNVLTQLQILMALRTIAPQDLSALGEWIKVHGTVEERRILFESLPSFPVGDAWIWSPGWPTEAGLFCRIHVEAIATFDSMRTPKVGEKLAPPKTLADVDLGELTKALAATIEKAKADDPKLLRARIAELERQVRANGQSSKAVDRQTLIESMPLVDQLRQDLAMARMQAADARKETNKYVVLLRALGRNLTRVSEDLAGYSHNVVEAVEQLPGADAVPAPRETPRSPAPRLLRVSDLRTQHGEVAVRRASVEVQANGTSTSEAGEPKQLITDRILDAIARFHAFGIAAVPRIMVALETGYTNTRSTGFVKAMTTLRSAGLVDLLPDLKIALTEAGRAKAGSLSTYASIDELHNAVLEHLGGVRASLLNELLAAYPEAVERGVLAEHNNYTNTRSTGFVKALGHLRTLGFADYPDGDHAVATDLLFPLEAVRA